MHGYDTYDYGARGYYPAMGRFTSVDPLVEKYYSISPYAYCAGNPVNRIDPDGQSTWVVQNSNGMYNVVGGDYTDKDLNVYVGSYNKDGKYERSDESIGETTLNTSFYNSDEKDPKKQWTGTIKSNIVENLDYLTFSVYVDAVYLHYGDNVTFNVYFSGFHPDVEISGVTSTYNWHGGHYIDYEVKYSLDAYINLGGKWVFYSSPHTAKQDNVYVSC